MIVAFIFSDKVQSILYAPGSKQLISGSDDQIIGLWDLEIKRQEVSLHYFFKKFTPIN